jgi:hypothetical protein
MPKNTIMKVSIALFLCFLLTGCFFGANESGKEIINDFYLASWDNDTWISYCKDGEGIWDADNILIGHNVFAVGDYDDFIIAKQHPCENALPHIQDYDNQKPNRNITNFYIIDSRNDSYVVHRYDNEKDFNEARTKFEIPIKLPYKFYSKEID